MEDETCEEFISYNQLKIKLLPTTAFVPITGKVITIDEAMNDLAFIATGVYGKSLPNQNGSPLRLVIPWKYGFKSIKSIVALRFVDTEPQTTWSLENSREYGFYSNVNPNIDHPRWTQATERRIGEFFRRPTLMFNGYEEEVSHLYKDMDLAKYY